MPRPNLLLVVLSIGSRTAAFQALGRIGEVMNVPLNQVELLEPFQRRARDVDFTATEQLHFDTRRHSIYAT